MIGLVGNKLDLCEKRVVQFSEAEAFAAEKGLGYYEVSAATDEGVETLFYDLARALPRKI